MAKHALSTGAPSSRIVVVYAMTFTLKMKVKDEIA